MKTCARTKDPDETTISVDPGSPGRTDGEDMSPVRLGVASGVCGVLWWCQWCGCVSGGELLLGLVVLLTQCELMRLQSCPSWLKQRPTTQLTAAMTTVVPKRTRTGAHNAAENGADGTLAISVHVVNRVTYAENTSERVLSTLAPWRLGNQRVSAVVSVVEGRSSGSHVTLSTRGKEADNVWTLKQTL